MIRLLEAPSPITTRRSSNLKSMMRYLLFDFAVTLSLALTILSHGKSIFVKHSTDESNSSIYPRNFTQAPEEGPPARSEQPFIVGEIVEVYEPGILPSYAFIAKITDVALRRSDTREGSHFVQEYTVKTNFFQGKVDASSIRPMETFKSNTRAMCQPAASLPKNSFQDKDYSKLAVPCTIDFPVKSVQTFLARGLNNEEQEFPRLYSVSIPKVGDITRFICSDDFSFQSIFASNP